MEADLQATAAALKHTSSAFYPTLDIEVAATRNDDTDSTAGTNDEETVVVWMSFNLFLGGGDRAGINEAEAREFVTRKALRSVGQTVEDDIMLIWNELEDILIRLKHLEAHMDSITEVLKVYKE